MRRTTLLAKFLLEDTPGRYRLPKTTSRQRPADYSSQYRPPGGDTGKMSPRSLRHLQRAVIALRSSGAFARAGVPGALKLARVSKKKVPGSGVLGMHIPTDVAYQLAGRGARRDFPAAGIKYGRFASISKPHPRIEYGRSALY